MGMDVSFLSRPKVKPGEALPMNILAEKKMPDDVSANVDRLHRYSKAMDIPFWECLNTALSEFLDKYDELYGAKEIVYWGRRGSAGWMVEHFAYHNSGYDMLLSKEDLEKFIADLDAVHNEDDCEHLFPCASIDDVYFARNKCKEILKTFDWENSDLIFYADW